MKTGKVDDKHQNLMRHAQDPTDKRHFSLNITTDKSTSLDLRKMGLWFKSLSSLFLQNIILFFSDKT